MKKAVLACMTSLVLGLAATSALAAANDGGTSASCTINFAPAGSVGNTTVWDDKKAFYQFSLLAKYKDANGVIKTIPGGNYTCGKGANQVCSTGSGENTSLLDFNVTLKGVPCSDLNRVRVTISPVDVTNTSGTDYYYDTSCPSKGFTDGMTYPAFGEASHHNQDDGWDYSPGQEFTACK